MNLFLQSDIENKPVSSCDRCIRLTQRTYIESFSENIAETIIIRRTCLTINHLCPKLIAANVKYETSNNGKSKQAQLTAALSFRKLRVGSQFALGRCVGCTSPSLIVDSSFVHHELVQGGRNWCACCIYRYCPVVFVWVMWPSILLILLINTEVVLFLC